MKKKKKNNTENGTKNTKKEKITEHKLDTKGATKR